MNSNNIIQKWNKSYKLPVSVLVFIGAIALILIDFDHFNKSMFLNMILGYALISSFINILDAFSMKSKKAQ